MDLFMELSNEAGDITVSARANPRTLKVLLMALERNGARIRSTSELVRLSLDMLASFFPDSVSVGEEDLEGVIEYLQRSGVRIRMPSRRTLKKMGEESYTKTSNEIRQFHTGGRGQFKFKQHDPDKSPTGASAKAQSQSQSNTHPRSETQSAGQEFRIDQEEFRRIESEMNRRLGMRTEFNLEDLPVQREGATMDEFDHSQGGGE
jgi:hypothetical protein